MTAVIGIEGVLRKDDGDPIPEGFKLYRTLINSYRVTLSTTSELKEVEHWLKTHYVFGYGDLYTKDNFYAEQPLRLRHLDLSKQGGKVELFIDSNPEYCAVALSQGIPSILFTTPKYFQSHRDLKPWDVITQEQIRQKEIVAERYTRDLSEGSRFE